ncbi:MAG TPA: hypothetical protein VEZ12_15825 [Herpetosiphonaceae bacterium]|jgi:uncharacterized protein (TIGR02588 family)|nr:hypothetical protein [Herpetosiphonaceae bacterium]
MSAQQDHRTRSPAEWATLGVVLLLLGAIIGLLLWYAVQPTTEARFEVTVETAAIAEQQGHYYVPLRVLNTGDATAEDVTVRAALLRDEQVVDEVELAFVFLAGGEEAEGVAVFDEDPRDGMIEAGVTSHLIP